MDEWIREVKKGTRDTIRKKRYKKYIFWVDYLFLSFILQKNWYNKEITNQRQVALLFVFSLLEEKSDSGSWNDKIRQRKRAAVV